MVSNYINRSISFFVNKKKLLIISLSIIILFLIGFIYNSYATSTGLSLGNEENTYDILLTDSTNTVTVPAKSSKTVYYQFSNTNKGTIKYHIGFISDNCTAKVWWDSEDSISDTIEYGEYKFIKLKLINESDQDDTIIIKPVLGYVDGGDVIPDSNTTLVTGTINEVNTMSVKPTDALTSLGIDKTKVEEISFVKDNIPSIDSLGSTNMNDDGSVKLWYIASDTEGMYKVYIGSDNGISTFPSNSGFFFKGFTKMIHINIKNIDTSKVSNMEEMFRQCNSVITLDLSSYNTSNTKYMNNMFDGCNSLSTLDISNFDTSSVQLMIAMFQGCFRLTSLDLSHFNTSRVTRMDNMFNGCEKLVNLDVSSFDTSKVTRMHYMFNNCNELLYLDVSHFDTSNVTDMRYMFYQCKKLSKIDVSGFNTSNVVSMVQMFYGCSDLTSLDLSNFDTSKVTSMRGMFGDCIKIKELDISNFNTILVNDMTYMFLNCSNLKTITFGDKFTLSAIIEDKNTSAVNYKGLYLFIHSSRNLDNDTLNSVLEVLSTAGSGVQTKTLSDVGFSNVQASTATTLSNYQMFTNAGWTTGY